MSRARFIEIVAELSALDVQLKPLLDRKASLEAERDAIWPDGESVPTREEKREEMRKRHVAKVNGDDTSEPRLGIPLALMRDGKRYRLVDGVTAGPRVLAFLKDHAGEWLKAKDVCAGMGLDRGHIPAVRSSLDRLVVGKCVQKNEDGEFRLAPSARRTEKEVTP